MTIPTIEDLVAPHLARLRDLVEAKRKAPVAECRFTFKDGADVGREYVAMCDNYLGRTVSLGYGSTLEAAIAMCVEKVEALPDLDLILGLTVDPTGGTVQ